MSSIRSFSKLLWLVSDVYLKPNQTSVMELFAKIANGLLAVNYSCRKAPSYMLDWVLITCLSVYMKKENKSGL